MVIAFLCELLRLTVSLTIDIAATLPVISEGVSLASPGPDSPRTASIDLEWEGDPGKEGNLG